MDSTSYLAESDDIRREIAIARSMIFRCEERLNRLNIDKDKNPELDLANLLTGREYQVLLLVRKAMSNEEIGKKLVLSQRTIETFVTNILMKTGCQNRTELLTIKILHS